MLSYTLAPENLVARVQQDDADIRAKAFLVQHANT
jgi:hypothetical protein